MILTNRRPRHGLKTRDEAWKLLEPYAKSLFTGIQAAWDWAQRILDQDPERRAVLHDITTAAMINDHFVFQVKNGLIAGAKVDLMTTGRMVRVSLAGELVLRMKKLDKMLRSKNIATKNQEEIYHQQGWIDGLDSRPTNITFGYVTGLAGTKIVAVYFTCPKSYSRNHWHIRIAGIDEGGTMLFDTSGFGGGPGAPVVGRGKKAEEA